MGDVVVRAGECHAVVAQFSLSIGVRILRTRRYKSNLMLVPHIASRDLLLSLFAAAYLKRS